VPTHAQLPLDSHPKEGERPAALTPQWAATGTASRCRLRFFVVSTRVWDLLPRAKHLFVAATFNDDHKMAGTQDAPLRAVRLIDSPELACRCRGLLL